MPTYDYECENKHRFEKWQSMKDDALTECVICGAPVRRIMHPAGIIFKGSGWYITDSRKGGSSDSDSSAKVVKSDSKSEGGDAKSDAKTDSKTEGGDTKSDANKSEAKSDSKSESKSENKSDSSASAKSGGDNKSGSSSE